MRYLLPTFVSFVSFVVLAAGSLHGQHVSFVPHDINPLAEYPACAVLDVNHDGKLDIASGGFWYEAPTWQKHFLREVEVIRGRFDDYSNLELDINEDGWTDLVSVNYRSKSLFWLEHPGDSIKTNPDSPWTKHLIDTPGPMETGRLHDIDGDGQLDILPNGIGFACWYRLTYGPDPGGKVGPRFVKHDLPAEVSGHGIGFGDINGDGRGDIVGPRGWLEAPEDRRRGRWLWHPEWELSRDASIPILVHDVDSDGDNDLIWGRGHRYGLYWLEQKRDGDSHNWERHAIDTSWAQPHSLLLADLDGDQQPELIAGKRYMGHEGKDPGEWDLLCAYAYSFDRDLGTWRRMEIYHGHRAGFGLDPRAADIDGDGDIDLVAADRCSLVLFENVGTTTSQRPEQPSAGPSVLYRRDEPIDVETKAGVVGPARSTEEYGKRRYHIQYGLETVMGALPGPSRRVPLDVQIESREETPDYVRIKLTYAAEPGDRVPALLLVPNEFKDLTTKALTAKALTTGQGDVPVGEPPPRPGEQSDQPSRTPTTGRGFEKAPAMLCLHPTNPDGKAQTAGLVGNPTRHYGHELAKRGFVCLIPDYPSFGDYKDYDFNRKALTIGQGDAAKINSPLYASGSMKAIWNNIRAVDLLETLPYVDHDNVGAIGHSLGGHNALYTAVFEPRLKCVVTSCGFTAFHDYYEGDLKGWTSDRYMPRIRDVYKNDPDQMPFDFPEVLAAIAPRGIYVSAPLHDGNFEVGGVKKCIAAAQPVFDLLGGKDQLVVEYPDCDHDFPDDVRERVYQWLEKQLK